MYNISNAAEIIKHKSFDKKKSTVVFAHGYAENIASGGTAISQFVNHYTNTNNNTTNLILLNSNSLIGLTLYFK